MCDEVAVRIRPLIGTEREKREMVVLSEVDSSQNALVMVSDAENFVQMSADRVFGSETGLKEIGAEYEKLIGLAVNCENAALILYGGAGSGKSYSVFGPGLLSEEVSEAQNSFDFGLVPQLITRLVTESKVSVSLSFLIIGKTQIIDLMSESGLPKSSTEGVTSLLIETMASGLLALRKGLGRRNDFRVLEYDGKRADSATIVILNINTSAGSGKIAICLVEESIEASESIQRYVTNVQISNERLIVAFLRKTIGEKGKVFLLATLSPTMYLLYREFASESIRVLQCLSRLQSQVPPSLIPASKIPSLRSHKPRPKSSCRPSRTASISQTPMTETSLMQLVLTTGTDISRVMESVRKKELTNAAEELTKVLPTQGRCPICTLKVPCTHFSSIPEVSKAQNDTQNTNPTPSRSRTPNRNLRQGTRRRNSSQMSEYPSPSPPAGGAVSNTQERTIRYRSRGGGVIIKTGSLGGDSKAFGTLFTDEKLEAMEKLEAYREEKLRKELLKLEEQRAKERAEQEAARLKEQRRQKYLEQQKQKLLEYHKSKETPISQEKNKPKSLKSRIRSQPPVQKISHYSYKREVINRILESQVEDIERLGVRQRLKQLKGDLKPEQDSLYYLSHR